jgi:hypothetical protein
MSITFFLSSSETCYPACPSCGGRMNGQPEPDRECSHPECEGYGPYPVSNTPELNVANTNAHVILRDLLGYSLGADVDPYAGTLDPADVQLRLSMAGYKVEECTRQTKVSGNYISFGLNGARIERYVSELSRLAVLAIRRGELICYG